jgi:hypothetical protein
VVSGPSRRRPHELQQGTGRNLVIPVPASLNRDGAPTRVLDGHVDIACERDHLFFGVHCAGAAGTDDDDPMT